MARSDRGVGSLAAGLPALAVVVLAACGQVTGLADDYRYDLEETGSDGAVTNGGDGGQDGAVATDGGRCNSGERAKAQSSIAAAGGQDITNSCRVCLSGSCCTQISACAENETCDQSMKCVFGCQRSGNKRQCLDNCSTSFASVVGACVESACPAPTCALQ